MNEIEQDIINKGLASAKFDIEWHTERLKDAHMRLDAYKNMEERLCKN